MISGPLRAPGPGRGCGPHTRTSRTWRRLSTAGVGRQPSQQRQRGRRVKVAEGRLAPPPRRMRVSAGRGTPPTGPPAAARIRASRPRGPAPAASRPPPGRSGMTSARAGPSAGHDWARRSRLPRRGAWRRCGCPPGPGTPCRPRQASPSRRWSRASLVTRRTSIGPRATTGHHGRSCARWAGGCRARRLSRSRAACAAAGSSIASAVSTCRPPSSATRASRSAREQHAQRGEAGSGVGSRHVCADPQHARLGQLDLRTRPCPGIQQPKHVRQAIGSPGADAHGNLWVPTAAVAVPELTGSWDQLGPGTARLVAFVIPGEAGSAGGG